MSGAAEAWVRFALQDLIDAVVQEVEQPSDMLMGAIRRSKEALALAGKEPHEPAKGHGDVRGLRR